MEQLARKLEDPTEGSRRRELGGEDPDAESLEAKIQVYEELLNMKKETLLEKELVLEEVSSLADKLRKQALEGRQDTLELAEKVNDFQAKIKDLTKKMMATVSELSMFQATALKLQQEKDEKERILEDANENIQKELPPSEEAEFEWMKMERARIWKEKESIDKSQKQQAEALLPSTVTKTTAEPRPNAYFQDELGIPKP